MKVLLIGGGICGLGTALLLARDGHDVTVLERDLDPLPATAEGAWDDWARKGVAQFRQPHNLMPGLRRVLEAELPDVQDALRDAGAAKFDMLNPMPPSLADRSPRPIDDQLWTYTGRRPMAEWVFGSAALNEPRVTIRRGVKVTELITGPSVIKACPTSSVCAASPAKSFAPTSSSMHPVDSRAPASGCVQSKRAPSTRNRRFRFCVLHRATFAATPSRSGAPDR